MNFKGFTLILRHTGNRNKEFSLKSTLQFDKINKNWMVFKWPGYYNSWNSCFSGEYHNAAAKLGEKIFIPQKSLEPKPFENNDRWEFKLCQFGVPFHVLKENSKGEFKESIEVIKRGNHDQMDELIVDISSIPKDQQEDLEIDLKIFKSKPQIGKENEVEVSFEKIPYKKWKQLMVTTYDQSSILYLDSTFDTVGREVELYREGLLDSQMVDKSSKELIPCKTYMRFKVKPLSSSSNDPVNISVNFPKVRDSFKHELLQSGIQNLERLETTLGSRFVDWSSGKKGYIAPLVSLCQSSGSGKTKLSIECIKRNPGFYLVFRKAEQTGYPRSNSLSRELQNIISEYNDPANSLMKYNYSGCVIGKILDFFTRIVSSYINAIVLKSRTLISTSDISADEAVSMSIKEVGKLFQDNESLLDRFEMFDQEKMNSIYLQYLNKTNDESRSLKVEFITKFITAVFKSPESCLADPADDSITKTICDNIAARIDEFPFLFILDEADLLADMKFKQEGMQIYVSGLEVLRRAFGYLEATAKNLFLTLGTKSDIIDFNPPVIDMSSRFFNRNSILEPITLTSNSNIFSKEFNIAKMKNVSCNLLRNPLMFKFIVTLGHGLWGSFPFSNVINSANMKLTNGSTSTKAYFLPVWMIRTGISASPFSVESRSLVANHMATLFDVESGLKAMTVSYPSEPVLALSARALTDANNDKALFAVLSKKTEAVAIDVGRFGELFAAMILLRAVDHAPNYALPAGNEYDTRLKEIKEMMPEFTSLWEKKVHLLEPENTSNDQLITDFTAYKVCRVADFLSSLTGMDLDLIKKNFPTNILEGIINASHMVNLNRDKEGFKVGDVKFSPRNLPSADTRILDDSRNIIDGALLKDGLLRQCAFFLPSRYYGLDMIIPVCLKSGRMTYIGVQVKAKESNLDDDVYKMQNRLHFVKCAHCQKFSETWLSPSCSQCTTNIDGLKEIYANSVTLLMSLAEDGTFSSFKSNISEKLQPKHKSDLETLKKALEPNFNSEEVKLKGKSTSFIEPLLQIVEPVKDNLAIIKSIWIDKNVIVKKLADVDENVKTAIETGAGTADDNTKVTKPSKTGKTAFIDDKFVHRQFCISTRGWKIFNRLFPEAEESFKIANDILRSEGLFKNAHNRNTPQIIRNVLHDISPNYLQFSDELWLQRGNFESNLEKLDKLEHEMKMKSKIVDITTDESKNEQIPTPPQSPLKK